MKSGLLRTLMILALTVLAGCTTSSPLTSPLTATPVHPTDTHVSKATLTATPLPPTTIPIPPTPTPKFIPPPAIIEVGQVWINSIDGSEMVSVPAGEFAMGSNQGTVAEGPAHMVYLDAFYSDKYEISNTQYRKCVEAGICSQLQKQTYYDDPDYAHHPVVNVTWHWANVYCEWARKRLPTEAEWEKAARGTDGRRYPWGDEIDCNHAQYKECGGQTVQVGSLPNGVSPYGARDMAGNVWEWVIDEWQEDYYQISPSNNPQGPSNPRNIREIHVFRGGSWSESADLLRSTYRSWYEPGAQYYNLGFRCVIDSPKSR
ncbi:MAG: SUMF1/EgtB/PvdO family nonheme iron enzyme [Anaerolineales bacterium]